MTDLIIRTQNVDQRNPGLADPLIQAGAIPVDQDAYSTIPDSTPLDRVYRIKGVSNMYVEIENTGVNANGLIYRIDNARKEFKNISELVDGDFDSEIKADTIVAPGVKATATVTINTPVANTFADGTITAASVTATIFATGTATLSATQAGDTLIVNGLTYTAVAGVKANDTEFSIDGTNNDDAADLADSIDNDTRSGTIGDLSATVTTNVVTITTDVLGTGGNAVTLAETGSGIIISSTFLLGGVNGDTVTVNGLVYSAVPGSVGSDFTRFSTDTGNTETATSLADSITNDVRTGSLADVTATSSLAVVTTTTDELGAVGNIVTLVSSNGTRLAVTGSGFFTGGVTADTLIINGIIFTAVAGAKTNFAQFSIDSTDTATATDLADSVTQNITIGTLGDVVAISAAAIVTLTQTIGGTVGNATTLTTSDGTRLAISGALFTGGTVGQIVADVIDNISPETTAMRISIKRETSGQDTTLAGIISVT